MLYRTIFSQLWQTIDGPEILLLNGARQVGKTTLLKMLKEKLIAERKLPESHILWYDLEKVEDLSIWSNQITALAVLPVKNKERHYLFIDEFQKSKVIGSILKVLHDHYPQFKIIITGSASWHLSINETLTGRKIVFSVWPLSFEEYLIWQQDQKLLSFYNLAKKNPQALTEELVSLLNQQFIKFLAYGGYPNVVLTTTAEQKIILLNELINSYLLRDVQITNYAINSLQIKKILTLLASQISSLLDITSLAANVGISRNVLVNRLELLQNTFILHFTRPYFTNKTKELVKNPKVRLVDTGLRNCLLQNFSLLPQTTDFGYLVENFAVTELYKTAGPLDQIFYWRTKQGKEVDIIKKRENLILPIEIKAGQTADIPNNLKLFIKTYHPATAYLLNWSTVKSVKYLDCAVHFRPFWFPI